MIFWTWLVFIALFLLLKRFAWPAIIGATEEREKRIRGQLDEAQKMNSDARAALDEHKELLAGAREEAHGIVAESRSLGEKEREQILEKARRDQESMLNRAKQEIEAERDRAVASLRAEAVDLSLAAASRLIGEKLDDDANRKLVTEYLESIGTGS